ncbi:hypothetical protein AMAG_10164 [Allomyces macrogynus ATCC 38327]|uniref:RING-type domain-containing protein n=1 Tax=Allomyces macrogynus (strain ATCC 38327) TaxID=578462 RepID=A0A0L0SQL2_ALLM3|nr:hypothetical protein AMAG_10164 [Allomyces macrogynus ATCC 38327]|eukprot:KNE64828.1 hypothetical protein AMAG_10164 [Allomyces macrogynus ATCC 38327]
MNSTCRLLPRLPSCPSRTTSPPAPPAVPAVPKCCAPPASIADLLRCPICHDPLAPAPPSASDMAIITLPCGNSLHRRCIPTAPSTRSKPQHANQYFDCPFNCCRVKMHTVPLPAPAGVDVVLTTVLEKWAAENLRPQSCCKRKRSDGSMHGSPTGSPTTTSVLAAESGPTGTAPVPAATGHKRPCNSRPTDGNHLPLADQLRALSVDALPSAPSPVPPVPVDDAAATRPRPASVADSFVTDASTLINTSAVDDTASLFSTASTSTATAPLCPIQRFFNAICPKRRAAQIADAAAAQTVADAARARDEADDRRIAEYGLECQLCYNLLHDAITLYPCGHTACRACFLRTLDHGADTCFLCRAPLPYGYLVYHHHAPNRTLRQFIESAFPRHAQARALALAAEVQAQHDQVPIFTCSLVLPGSPARLHVFEPRYRLMMRRVTAEGAPKMFGMCAPASCGPGPASRGTMLKVQSFQLLDDGRFLVEAVGIYPFQILAKTCTDGYCTATVKKLDDCDFLRLTDTLPPPAPLGPNAPTVRDLVCQASRTLEAFLSTLPVPSRQGFLAQYGCMPCDPALFTYWLASVLPVEIKDKSKLLGMRSARDRLALVWQWAREVKARCPQVAKVMALANAPPSAVPCVAPCASGRAAAPVPVAQPAPSAQPATVVPSPRSSASSSRRRSMTTTATSGSYVGEDEDDEMVDDDYVDVDEDEGMESSDAASTASTACLSGTPASPAAPATPAAPSAPAAPTAPAPASSSSTTCPTAPPDLCVIM